MGYLELLHPRNAGLDESHVQHVLGLMPHLQKLEGQKLQSKLFSDNSSLFLLIVLILYIDLPRQDRPRTTVSNLQEERATGIERVGDYT